MKRSTAIRHLVEVAGVASEGTRFRETELGWPLEELWADGEYLDAADEVAVGSVIAVLDLPIDQVAWLAINPAGEWIGEQLRLGKRPVTWCYRPLLWPAWNHAHRRVIRFWTAADGLDEAVIAALGDAANEGIGGIEGIEVIEPNDLELAAQLRTELPVSRAHLRATLDGYWDREWRRSHRGTRDGGGPEDHLWRAAEAVTTIEAALAALGSQAPTT